MIPTETRERFWPTDRFSPFRGGFQVNSAPPPADAGPEARALAEAAPNCAALYCARHRLRPSGFVPSVLWRTLYPESRYIGFPLVLLLPRTFAPDREFIVQVGRVASMEQYTMLEEGFRRWPGHRSFLRGTLGVRVASHRVRRLVEDLFDGGPRAGEVG